MEKQCKSLQVALEKELKKTSALRVEIDEMKKKLRSKTEVETFVENTLTKYDELQIKYEEECKKQSKMEHQIKVRSKSSGFHGHALIFMFVFALLKPEKEQADESNL